ncbi:hypothetical protein WA1_13410 [Scytonema hofmannii PCC 7110]|uniref:Uncharacterized protein n=1 Tax=Scytonema hofmannii PCC 7110 TaxID=128403 RepID=A0A139XEH0_9CYAN|nr:hypothetical protein [Scytonema hofmannii]KYC43094.1 hypothetical protein WA1_13410 [Scytonema hofmannii PCC 7110]
MSSDDELISREEVLVGLPARRANTLLFLIESRTAQIAARSRVEFSLTEQSANERDLAFLETFALGNTPLLHPTIQQLERHASQWAFLVPENPRLKAAIAQALGRKYTFTYQAVPNIRATLGLDEKAVQFSYSRLYRTQLLNIFASSVTLIEQLRWMLTAISQRIESLPPFWLASLLTVALGLPQAFLALPIAVVDIGPLATVAFLLIVGVINSLTMACMAEAFGRSGDFRYGHTFIKQLVSNYLGEAGSFILSIAVGIRVFFIALACYIGLSTTMANFTHIPAELWTLLFFGAGLYLLSRKSLNFTVAVLVLLAAINVSLLFILLLLALGHMQLENLSYVNLPFLNGQPFQPWILQRVFGVSLMLYFGHVYVGECAKIVLPRDPSASSLIWGSVAGTAFLTLLFCIWVLVVNGAIAPQILARQSGTALEPLALQIGPIVSVLGAVLVTLLLGMAWLRSSSLLVNLAKEWLPAPDRPVLMLPRQGGTLIFHHPSGNSTCVLYIGISYLGIVDAQPKFQIDIQLKGNTHHVEIAVTEHWEIKELLAQFPDLRQWDTHLMLDIRSANHDRVYLQITSSMLLAYEASWKVELNNTTPECKSQISRSWMNLLNQRRFFLSISPLVLVFLLTEWLFFAGTQSFTNILAFAGVLGNSLVGGIFPILLLVSSRQKGELMPGVVFKILNHPFFSVGIYSIFLGILFVHGLFIWQNPWARISALSIALLSLGATVVMKLYGAFASRVVIELRDDQQQGGHSVFTITVGGQPKIAEVLLGYAEGEVHHQAATVDIPVLSSLRYAIFCLPTKSEKEMRVWTHGSNYDDKSNSLPTLVEIESGNKKMQFDLRLSSGKVLLPLISENCWLKFTFPERSLS